MEEKETWIWEDIFTKSAHLGVILISDAFATYRRNSVKNKNNLRITFEMGVNYQSAQSHRKSGGM